MSGFIIGEHVRVVTAESAFQGEVGVVSSVLSAQPFPYLIDFSEHGVTVPFAAQELGLVK